MTAPVSPRRRRLRWTLSVLGLVSVSALVVGFGWYQKSRPAAYRPDERPDDITNDLARRLPPGAPRPSLEDVTAAAGLSSFRNFTGNRTSQLPEDMGPGAAWGDYDNDGDDDLFLVSAGGSMDVRADQLRPCALYENVGDGTFRVAAGFPEMRLRGYGAAWGDYDGDGWMDLVVTGYDTIRLLHNERGTGRFAEDTRLADLPGFWTGVAWADFDHDRRLDLYVCHYVVYEAHVGDRDRVSDQIGTAVPFTLNPASYPGGRNALFRQNADGSFTDVAAELKVQNPEGRSLGALWHDFDNDGWLDLYVANDVSDNVFYWNVGGRFQDVSHAARVADYRSAMGLAAGDFDRDGDDDLHVTHWVAQENGLYENLLTNRQAASFRGPAASSVGASAGPRPAAVFVDVADQRGVGHIALPFVGWGTEFVDVDQDGWLDLLVVNGSTIESEGLRPRKLQPQEAFLLWNEQGRFFHNLAPLHSGLNSQHVSRGLGCADYDLDGDVDVLVTDLQEGVRLYRNDMASGHWVKLRLRSQTSDGRALGFGDGSTVIAWVGDVPLRRSVTGVSYLSQSSHTLHWGLGSAARLDRIEVRWHAGSTQVFEGVDANAFYEVVEGESAVRRLDFGRSSLAQAAPTGPSRDASTVTQPRSAGGGAADDRQRLIRFWSTQRAAMNAMKVERDNAKATALFREAITLNPQHEDSRYYLGLCLASLGDIGGALNALEGLQQLSPQSHRAWQQWGVVRALFARSDADLVSAERALQRAQAINPEETGALLALGEVALLRGDRTLAEDRLAAATRTNPRAVGGFFLRGYLAWRKGDGDGARQYLEQARQALGPDWQPKGATSEGDVQHKQHVERSPLTSFWEGWNGQPEAESAFRALHARLALPFTSEASENAP